MSASSTPKYLNLIKIRMSIMAFISIIHRISGLLWVIIIPVGLYLLQLSVSNENGFEQVALFFQQAWVRVLLGVFLLLFAHHFFSGIRFLLLDMQIGLQLSHARISAKMVLVFDFLTLILLWVSL